MLWTGLLGIPFFFLRVEMLTRDSSGICSERCGFVNAHLVGAFHLANNVRLEGEAYGKEKKETKEGGRTQISALPPCLETRTPGLSSPKVVKCRAMCELRHLWILHYAALDDGGDLASSRYRVTRA